MKTYVARRAAQMVLVVVGVVTVTFFAVRLVPGDPARIMNRPGTPESVLKLTRQQLGTDKPIPVQYVAFLGDLVRGDLGESFRGGRPVLSAVLEALPNTFALGVVSMLVTTTLAGVLGIAAALRPNGLFDRLALLFVAVAQATPSFWLGVMLGLVVAIQLRWFPANDLTGPRRFASIYK